MKKCLSGSSCSKLTTPLVNVLLKFQSSVSQIHQYFLLKKCEKLLQSFSHFFNKKNIEVFGYKVVKHLTCGPLNGLVKLTMLWTNGSCSDVVCLSMATEFTIAIFCVQSDLCIRKTTIILETKSGKMKKLNSHLNRLVQYRWVCH